MPDLTRAAMTSRLDQKSKKARKTEQDRRAAYRLVDIRDGYRCRCCTVKVSAHSPDLTKRLEHHHIRGRFGKDAETTANIVTLCKTCHDLRHVKRTLVITGNADQLLTFSLGGKEWNN